MVGTRQPLLDSPCLLPAIALLSLAMEQLGEEVPNSIARCKLSVAANISRLDQRSDRPNFTIAELRGIVVKSMDRTTSIKQKRQNERWTGPPKKRKGGVRGLTKMNEIRPYLMGVLETGQQGCCNKKP